VEKNEKKHNVDHRFYRKKLSE